MIQPRTLARKARRVPSRIRNAVLRVLLRLGGATVDSLGQRDRLNDALRRRALTHPSPRGTALLVEDELLLADPTRHEARDLVIARAGHKGVVRRYLRLVDEHRPEQADQLAVAPLIAHRVARPKDDSLRAREYALTQRVRAGSRSGDPEEQALALELAEALLGMPQEMRANRFGVWRTQEFLEQVLMGLVAAGEHEPVKALLEASIGDSPTRSDALLQQIVRVGKPGASDEELDRLDLLPPDELGKSLAFWVANQHLAADDLGQALVYAEAAARAGERRGADLARGIRGLIRVLDGSGLPQLEPQQAYEPVPGRIVHVVRKALPFDQAGYTIRTGSLVHAQRRLGLDPHIVTRNSSLMGTGKLFSKKGPEVVDFDGTPVYRINAGTSGVPLDESLQQQVEAVARVVAELRPAVIHAASDFTNAVIAGTVARAFGVPYVYEVRGFWEVTRLSRQSGLQHTDRYVRVKERESAEVRAADAVVTLARTMRAELVERGVPDERIMLAPNAVDPAEVVTRPRDPARMSRLGLAGADLVVGYVSSLNDYEGVETLVSAVAALREAGRDVRLLVVGDGPMRQVLEAQARRLNLGAAAVFTGGVPHAEVSELYACLDVFVVPRRDLPVCRLVSPLKPYEAMLLGLPLVVSDLPVLRELNDSGAVEVFPPDDSEGLAKVLGELIDDPERRRANAERGRAWVLAERTWDGNAARYRDLYERLIQGGV